MATFKHISSKNNNYGAAERYLLFQHDEFSMKPSAEALDDARNAAQDDAYKLNRHRKSLDTALAEKKPCSMSSTSVILAPRLMRIGL
ncbi:MAG: hypothetical protein EOM64_05690 [Erysipelotrichia bacterium]|nr:hypothetical protein [Erysipelotrichia bacterium]